MFKFYQLMLPAAFVFASVSAPVYAAPEKYELDSTHTHVTWKVNRFGYAFTVGSFAGVNGNLTLDEANPQNSNVHATIDAKQIRSDFATREDHLRSPNWLDVVQFPAITFKSDKVTLLEDKDGKKRARVSGQATIKGVTQPLEMTITLNKIAPNPLDKKKTAGFTATGSLKRSKFGLSSYLGAIADSISFEINAVAVAVE